MRRRRLLQAFALLVAWPLRGLAQQPARIPVLGYLAVANLEPAFGHFRSGLEKLGYQVGQNVRIEARTAEGKPERLAALAGELVRLKVDILVASQTPAVTAAKQATREIPIVMAGAGDPVGTGLVASLARPGGNITGMSATAVLMGAKTLELIREVTPSAKRVGVLANAADPFTTPFLEQLREAGRSLALEIAPRMIRQTAELEAAFAEMQKERCDFVVVQPSLQRRVAAGIALQRRMPAVSPSSLFPGEGGLLSYSADQVVLHREAAIYVDRILKGAKPGDLPVQQPVKFELVVNLRSAKALGIAIPGSVLARADRVIE